MREKRAFPIWNLLKLNQERGWDSGSHPGVDLDAPVGMEGFGVIEDVRSENCFRAAGSKELARHLM